MEETIFPPSPSWFLPNILATRKDGSVTYGSKKKIVILKSRQDKKPEMLIIPHAHSQRVTAVAFSPSLCSESLQNTVVSCSEDGFVKLWKIDTLNAVIGHKSHWEEKGEIGKIITLDWSVANPHYIVSVAENNSLVLWDILSNSATKFSFHNLGAVVISCCPYNEKIVGVGGKTGQIYILNLSGKGDILYRLRGHDNKINSISWCPVPYNVFKANEIHEEFLLSSACQNKEVFIWRAGTDGKCETKFQIPTSALYPKDGAPHGKIGNSFSYIALCWLEPYKIYLSSNFGELIYFDIQFYLSNMTTNGTNSGQKSNKHSLNFVKLEHQFHTKGVFAIAGIPVKGELVLYKNISIKSELKFSVLSNAIKVTEKPEEECEKDITWEVIKAEEPCLMWLAGQDRKLVACEINSSKMKIVYSYNTINGVVNCTVVSPHDPNKLAIGAGDGMIRLWNLTQPHGNTQVYWQKIKDRVMSLDWHPTKDGLLAYGTSEGRVGLIDTKSNKLPSVFKPSHPNPIFSLSWGPRFPTEGMKDPSVNLEYDLYCVGTYILSLYDPSKLNADPLNLSKIISFPCKKQTDVRWKSDYSLMAVGNEDGSICLVEPLQYKIINIVLAYKKLIQSIAWHPSSTSIDAGLSPYHGYFTSGSTDNSNEIRVFNCKKNESELKVEQVATLKGHQKQIQSVAWCPHISGRLVSTSADHSVQIWDVISQAALVKFTPIGKPMFSVWSPIDPDFIITGCKNDVLCVWRISTETKVFPTPVPKTKKPNSENSIQLSVLKEITTEEAEGLGKTSKKKEDKILSVAETKTYTKTSKEPKMFSDMWKGSGSDELKVCYSLLKAEGEEGIKQTYSLPFLCDENQFNASTKDEEEAYKKANNWIDLSEIALWKGNIKDVLEEKIRSGQLNDFLISLAPSISLRVWQEACLSYSKTLTEKKYYRRAASYLVVCNKIYEAIQLLIDANLYLEAIFIARSRLPKSDRTLENVIRKYAEWLSKNGSFLRACQCYIYLEDYLGVAKICGKTNHPEYLSLAALAAKKCKATDLETLEATNAVFKCFETNNFELAQQVCDDHDNLKHLGLLFSVYYMIHQLEAGELELKTDILSHIRESFDTKSVIFPSSLPKFFHRHAVYRNKRQVLKIVAQELCYAACSENLEEIITHLIKALSTSYRYTQNPADDIHLSYKLCRWLSPDGFLSDNSFFSLQDRHLSSKIKSLRAFLCASIVRHLNEHNESSDMMKFFDTLKSLKDELIDADSCKYFKNLIDVKIYETELLERKSRLSKSEFGNGKNYEDFLKNDVTTEDCNLTSEINGADEKELQEAKTERNSLDKGESNIIQMEEGENLKSNSILDKQDKLDQEMIETTLEVTTDTELQRESEDKVKRTLDVLSRLKTEIENFEIERISSPCPIPVYAMLKKLCEEFPQIESANFLLQDLEEKYRVIN